jgi:sec-independent protein translocase protein TatA
VFETIGAPELIIIGLVLILLFGAGKVAHLGKGLGDGVREFRRAMNEDSAEPTLLLQAPEDPPALLPPPGPAVIVEPASQPGPPQIF